MRQFDTDLDAADGWDAAPAPLSPADHAALQDTRRLQRWRQRGALAWFGLILTQIPTWWWFQQQYNQIGWPLWPLAWHAVILWLALRPTLFVNRLAFGLSLPYLILGNSGYSAGCCLCLLMPDANPAMFPLLFGAIGLQWLLKAQLAKYADRRAYFCFCHWHLSLESAEACHFNDGHFPARSSRITRGFAGLTLLLMIPCVAATLY